MNVQDFVKTIRKGNLTCEEIGKGMHKSYINACELIEDAEYLLPKRPARALSLAILALEEIAKTITLTNAAAKARDKKITWSEVEKELKLKSHSHKQTLYAAYGKAFLDKLGQDDKDLKKHNKFLAGVIPLLDWMKQLGFYVDVADGVFVSPEEFGNDNKEWAIWLIEIVKRRLDTFKPLHETEEKSIAMAKRAGELTDVFLASENENVFKEKLREYIQKYKQNA